MHYIYLKDFISKVEIGYQKKVVSVTYFEALLTSETSSSGLSEAQQGDQPPAAAADQRQRNTGIRIHSFIHPSSDSTLSTNSCIVNNVNFQYFLMALFLSALAVSLSPLGQLFIPS